jgi:hypothetical protein
MIHRTPLRHFFRVLIFLLAVIVPLLFPISVPVLFVVTGALLAYDGPNRTLVPSVTAVLMSMELIGGWDLGMMSLPWCMAVALWIIAGRVMNISPWSQRDGWNVVDVIVTACSAAVIAGIMTIGSVVVAAEIYGFGMVFGRLISVLSLPNIGFIAAVSLATVIVLRRIDVPFRRTIHFGIV